MGLVELHPDNVWNGNLRATPGNANGQSERHEREKGGSAAHPPTQGCGALGTARTVLPGVNPRLQTVVDPQPITPAPSDRVRGVDDPAPIAYLCRPAWCDGGRP